jgi:hypothetical protein
MDPLLPHIRQPKRNELVNRGGGIDSHGRRQFQAELQQTLMKKKTVMTMKLVKLITIQGQGMKHVQVKLAMVVEAEAVVVEEVAVEAGVDKVVYLVVVVVIAGDNGDVFEVETGNAAPLKIRQRTKKCATPSLIAKLEANTPHQRNHGCCGMGF